MDLVVPSKPSTDGLRIDAAAVTDAAAELGLTFPIRISWSNGRRKLGCYRFKTGTHSITVTRFYRRESAARLSETLWHELTHARQLEETVKAGQPYQAFHAEYRAETTRKGYRQNRFEVEARRVGAAMAERMPLVVGQAVHQAFVPKPQPVSTPKPKVARGYAAGPVGTGCPVAVQRINRRTGHMVQVIDTHVHPDYSTGGFRWVVRDTVTGNEQRFAGKREAKGQMATFA